MNLLWYGLSSIALGVILFFPTRKFMLAVSVNRFQRRLNRQIKGDELEAIRKRVTVIAAVVCVTFAFIYNKFLMLRIFGGMR